MRKLLEPLLWIILVGTGFGLLLRNSPDAREVAGQGFKTIFGVLTTPFILETTMAIVGLLIVLQWNQHKRKKETIDEWIEMEVPTRPQSKADKSEKGE